MTEEEKVVTGEVVDNTDYIAAIKELKQNSVDREKYNQVVSEKKALLDALVNGEDVQVPNASRRSSDEIRKEMFTQNSGLSNLEYAKDALELRENLISEGKPDPFVPIGRRYTPTDEDINCANKVAQVLQECIDYAEGDNAVFTNELQRRMVDVKIR
jgi:hypothetical protein